jgi:hypothetical protein
VPDKYGSETDAEHRREIERRNQEHLRKIREDQRRKEEEHLRSIRRNFGRDRDR